MKISIIKKTFFKIFIDYNYINYNQDIIDKNIYKS